MARAQRILIVEDDENLRHLIRRSLAFSGFEVAEAGNGLHALRQLDTNPPDAIILDLGLPIISGQTVRAEIAAHAHTRDIPVIVITGIEGPHPGLGAVCILRKPFDVDHLVMVVRRCIASGSAAMS